MLNKTVKIPQWNWKSIRGYLINQDNQDSQQLGNCIVLQNKNSQLNQIEDSIVKVSITSSGSLQFDEDQGWKWHKSWILPDFKIELKIRSSTGNICHPPNNTYIEIFQVKQISEQEWVDVGMKGVSKIETYKGYAELGKGLRLSSTSYGHQGSRFHLLIGGYVLDQGQKKFFFTLSSPPIYVDSRKSDREFKLQRESFFNELFEPEQIDKIMFKQVFGEKLIEIEDSPQGFYNYITASNLRNKIKHPIYLALKFPSVFHFLYKGNQQPSDQKLIILLEKLQKNLIYQKQISNREESLIFFVTSFKYFKKNRKLKETLKYISNLINVIHEDQIISPNQRQFYIISSDQLRKVYLENIVKLQTIHISAKRNLFKLTEKDDQSMKEKGKFSESNKVIKQENDMVKINKFEDELQLTKESQIFSNKIEDAYIKNLYIGYNHTYLLSTLQSNFMYNQYPFNPMYKISGRDFY